MSSSSGMVSGVHITPSINHLQGTTHELALSPGYPRTRYCHRHENLDYPVMSAASRMDHGQDGPQQLQKRV